MKNIFLYKILIVLILLCSCKEKVYYKNEVTFFLNKEIERIITNEKKGLIDGSYYTANVPVFILAGNDSLAFTSTDQIFKIYNLKDQRNKNFNIFLNKILNQDTLISRGNFKESDFFLKDKTIENEYEKVGIDVIIKNYSIHHGSLDYIDKSKLKTHNQLMTVMYLLSINDYYITFDDMSGYYIINKWDTVILKKQVSPAGASVPLVLSNSLESP